MIGAFAGPRDPGTASVRLMHHQGDLLGVDRCRGYVEGGMGRVSFAIAEAAKESGATLAAGVPVERILPGEGVEIESGELIDAPVVISNADPKRTLAMLGEDAVPAAYRERIEGWRTESPVVKLNAGLHSCRRSPRLEARRRTGRWSRSRRAWTPLRKPLDACRRGSPRSASRSSTSRAPTTLGGAAGRHTMSVFAQYAPTSSRKATGSRGGWRWRAHPRRHRRLRPDVHDCVEYLEVLGPPDVERRIGLTGGHIFQGEALPEQMWIAASTTGLRSTGCTCAGRPTHPAGSVIALNGRNAAMAVIEDAGTA